LTACVLVVLAAAHSTLAGQVTVIDMIPNSLSGETARDSEPNLSVNPARPEQVVASAFTPDPLGGSNLPLFVSNDGGFSWSLTAPVIAGTSGVCISSVCDITLRFAGSSDLLYVSDLNPVGGVSRLDIWRVSAATTAAAATALQSRNGLTARRFPDQPYVQAATVPAGAGAGNDRLFVGNNDLGVAGPQTATVDHTANATPPPPSGFSNTVIETRATDIQDDPSVRPAVHTDGTVYALYAGRRPGGTEVVVARDDSWATGATPFRALTDADGQPGIRVVSGLTSGLDLSDLGTQRLGSGLSIAVDPRNSRNLYITYGEGSAPLSYTLHVRGSSNGGATWSGDLYTVAPATNPGLAVTTDGEVGFLFQKLNGARWETHLVRTSSNFEDSSDLLLANVPNNAGSYPGNNPIGDYASLQSAGRDFYGVFSANNTPDPANFAPGVVFQRNHDFTAHTLTDLAGRPVAVSVDPFFFRVSGVAAVDDFFVRDWSDSPTVHDEGQEPSSNPVFFANSDVWNRRDNTAGAFDAASDRPAHEDPQEAGIGNNFAFVRIHRKAAGAAADVQARFLYADFGLGTAYVDAASTTPPTLSFAAGDTVTSLADGAGFEWTVPATHSDHLCMGVEISGPNDVLAGDLIGHAPGWPTTDLMVLNDNNKAQRNMGVWKPPVAAQAEALTYYAQIHNAATAVRDVSIRFDVSPETAPRLRISRIEAVSGPEQACPTQLSIPKCGRALKLRRMQPGENRWLGVTLSANGGPQDELLPAYFTETRGSLNLNGIGIGLQPVSLASSIGETLAFHAAVFHRLAALFGTPGAGSLGDAAVQLRKENPDAGPYLGFVRNSAAAMAAAGASLLKGADPLGVKAASARLDKALAGGDAGQVDVAHAALLQKLDVQASMLDKAKGDSADILQNVAWQRDLYRQAASLKAFAPLVVEASSRYIDAFEFGQAGPAEFKKLIADLLTVFQDTARALNSKTLDQAVAAMAAQAGDVQGLQGAHRQFLLRLQDVAR